MTRRAPPVIQARTIIIPTITLAQVCILVKPDQISQLTVFLGSSSSDRRTRRTRDTRRSGRSGRSRRR